MKTLIIVDHPNFSRSVVNRRWLEEVKKYPDEFLIHNLQSVFPQKIIDSSYEHSIMDNNGSIVFQFPLYWLNCPSLLKNWFDTVLTENWAFGSAYHLEGKKVAFAVSCGGAEEQYNKETTGYSVEDYLNSLIMSMKFCKADYQGTFVFYGAQGNIDSSSLSMSAKNYIDFLHALNTNNN